MPPCFLSDNTYICCNLIATLSLPEWLRSPQSYRGYYACFGLF